MKCLVCNYWEAVIENQCEACYGELVIFYSNEDEREMVGEEE